MSDITEIMLVLALIILPVMLLIMRIFEAIAKLNLNDYYLIAAF